jgi:hypothetical protein
MAMFSSFWKKQENRVNTRYSTKVPAFLTQENNPDFTCIVFIHNLSGGGALVSSTMSITMDQLYTLHIKLPYHQKWFGRDEIEVIAQGKVVRINEDDKRYAIQFLGDYRIKTTMPS